MRLFYAAPILLGPGSTVLPGNWHRMLRGYGDNANFYIPVFEEIRRLEFPDAVSHLSCVFCCETEAGLRDFVNSQGRPLDEMYEVETIDREPRTFKADWDIVRGITGQYVWAQVEEMARRYWSTAPGGRAEVLSEGPVEVIRHIPR